MLHTSPRLFLPADLPGLIGTFAFFVRSIADWPHPFAPEAPPKAFHTKSTTLNEILQSFFESFLTLYDLPKVFRNERPVCWFSLCIFCAEKLAVWGEVWYDSWGNSFGVSCNTSISAMPLGNSLSLSVRCGRRQLPQPLGSSLAREPCTTGLM